MPRPHRNPLRPDEARRRMTDVIEGTWPRERLEKMDAKFCRAMARAPEVPTGEGPDRVVTGVLPRRVP